MSVCIQKAIRRLTDYQKKIQRRLRLISLLRAATFFLTLAIIFAWSPGEVHLLPSLPGWLVFGFLVRWYSGIRRKENSCINRLEYYRGQQDRSSNAWFLNKGAESQRADSKDIEELQIEKDLLLTGSYSLLSYLETRLPAGEDTLYAWMRDALKQPDASTIQDRQNRIFSLRRLKVLQGRWYGQNRAQPVKQSSERDDRSLQKQTKHAFRTVPAWLAAVAGTLALISLGAFFSHEILGTKAYHFLSFPLQWLLFGIYLLFYRNKEARQRFDELLSSLDQTLPFLRCLQGFRFHDSHLYREQELTKNLRQELGGAIVQDSFYSLFRNPLAFALGGLLFSGPVLADWSMGGFLKKNEAKIRGWLQDFAAMDAMLSLAGHSRFLEPMCRPEIVSGNEPEVFALQLHHPLIPAEESVGNDLDFRKEHRLWIVTGSNMGGKSTFLRTLGMNLVLAQMGGAVRARQLKFCPTPMVTSMQIQDNLARSESLFYAEVRSLKRLVDHPSPVFYFLDEMLKGTNQTDRSFACKKILSHLIDSGSSGLLTTHDMELASLKENYGQKVQLFHFRESPGEGLQFDFKLHPGSVEGTTALTILRREGLPV